MRGEREREITSVRTHLGRVHTLAYVRTQLGLGAVETGASEWLASAFVGVNVAPPYAGGA